MDQTIKEIENILRDKEHLTRTGKVKLNKLKKLLFELQQNYIKGLSACERLIVAIDQEVKNR